MSHARIASDLLSVEEQLTALLLLIADGAAPTYIDSYGQHHYDLAVSPVVAEHIARMQNMDQPW